MDANGWAAVAGGIGGFMKAWLSAYAQKAADDAQGMIDNANTYSLNAVSHANADAANAVRRANNGFAVSQAALSNLTRSIGNQSKLEAGGKAGAAITTNILRLQDQAVHGTLENQLRSAEQLGAVRAQAAAAGVGGTTARMLQNTLQLTAAREQTTTDQNTQYQTYDMLQQRAGLVSNRIMSLDEGQTFAPIDYNINVAPLVQSPLRAGQFRSSIMSQAWLGALSGALGSPNFVSSSDSKSDPGTGSTGSIGNTSGYSSDATLFGPNTFKYEAPTGYSGGGIHGFFSTGSSSKIADYQLK